MSAKRLKKFGNCVGFSNSRSERVKIMDDKTKGFELLLRRILFKNSELDFLGQT